MTTKITKKINNDENASRPREDKKRDCIKYSINKEFYTSN